MDSADCIRYFTNPVNRIINSSDEELSRNTLVIKTPELLFLDQMLLTYEDPTDITNPEPTTDFTQLALLSAEGRQSNFFRAAQISYLTSQVLDYISRPDRDLDTYYDLNNSLQILLKAVLADTAKAEPRFFCGEGTQAVR